MACFGLNKDHRQVYTVARELFHCWHTDHATRTKLIIFNVLRI
jgi:hypothetical protein